MKANELRIGNWVYIPQTKTNEQIGVIEENGRFLTKGYKTSYSSIECSRPIPLTEEWLLRFGFEDDRDNLMVLRKDVFEFFFDKKDICGVNLYEKWDGNFLCGDIQYVHQLQNLYFALTGEELVVNEQ
jgi:hypothetical protein